MCSLLRLKRATQFLDLTRPCAARHLGFNRYWRAFGVGFGTLGGRGYDSFRIHDSVPQKLKARGCRNALVSDASCKGNARRWTLEGRRRDAASVMPMLEAFKQLVVANNRLGFSCITVHAQTAKGNEGPLAQHGLLFAAESRTG